MRAFRGIFLPFVAVMMVGCGTHPETSAKLESESAPHIFMAVMGGNSSCLPDDTGATTPYGIKMYPNFKQLKSDLESQSHYQVDFLVSCYNSDSTVHYYASNDPETLLDMQVDDVPGKIAELTAGNGVTDVYLAGHSYGGWTVMKTLLSLDQSVHVNGLFTIDPISMTNCGYTHPLGCQAAPSDITHDEREDIHARAGRWDNFWENGTFYLHSSAIPEADSNTQVAGATHFTIQTTSTVWDVVAERVKGLAL